MPRPNLKEATEQRKARKTSTKPLETIVETAQKIGEVVSNVSNTVQSAASTVNAVKANLDGLRQTFTTGSHLTNSPSLDSYKEASNLAAQYGIADINPREFLGQDPYKADGNIPQMSAKEANEQKLIIQKQNNALEVRKAKVDQGRKVISLATDNAKLVGDVVKLSTAQIETATTFIDNKVADTNYQIRQSKLEETEQRLEQQRIATHGTTNLTPLIREEWQLKLQKQETKNQALRLEVEGAIKQNEINQEMLEARLLEM